MSSNNEEQMEGRGWSRPFATQIVNYWNKRIVCGKAVREKEEVMEASAWCFSPTSELSSSPMKKKNKYTLMEENKNKIVIYSFSIHYSF